MSQAHSLSKGVAALAMAAVIALAAPHAAAACATCYGAADAPMTHGMNMGILALLGCVALVYAGVGKVIWDFRKRSQRLARPRLRLIDGGKQ